MDFSDYQHLTFERLDHGVLLCTLDRPERLNAAHEPMHGELARVWTDIHRDPDTRAVVVTGAGSAFSAGGDLAMVRRVAGNYPATIAMLRETQELVHNMVACDTPIVSAINGTAVGAGLVVALLADISIAAEGIRVTDGHLRLGVAAGDHAAIVWPLLCGMAKAKYYLLTADFIDAAEAERIGLISRCVPAAELMPSAIDVATRLATGPQHAIRLTKRALNGWLRLAGPTFDASAAYEMLTFFGPDVAEGADAIVAHRPPVFPTATGPAFPSTTDIASGPNGPAGAGDPGAGDPSAGDPGAGDPPAPDHRADTGDRKATPPAGNAVQGSRTDGDAGRTSGRAGRSG
jgi:enoyl-CoA hydratase